MKFILPVLVPIAACLSIYGQASSGQNPQFEVASIRPSAAPGADHVEVGVHIDGAQVRCTQLSLKDYIIAAFRVKNYQVTGSDGLGERFDISAKLPSGAKDSEVPDMLQSLLVDRFQMKFHKEKKDFPIYALVIAKGGFKGKETPVDKDSPRGGDEAPKPAVNVSGMGGRGGVHINLGNGSYFSLADNKFEARKLTMTNFADTMARFEDRPVIDMTGLAGNYDIDLAFTPEDYMAMLIRSAIAAGVSMPPEAMKALEYSSGDSLHAALEKVGLKLEARKAPLDMFVIDHISKTPTEN